MNNVATAQLESESFPVLDPIPRLGRKGRYSQRATGQGVDVTLAGWIYGPFTATTPTRVVSYSDTPGISIEPTAYNAQISQGVTIATVQTSKGTDGVFVYESGFNAPLTGVLELWTYTSGKLVFGSYIDSRLSDIERKFEFREKNTVLSFLRQNDFLIPLILESAERIRSYFEKDARLIMELVEDSESDGFEELFLIVKTSHAPAEASRLLERFDEEWWLQASRRAQCKLNIDYELTDV